MRSGISIGHVFGIEIRLDYSWFILFVLILISFSSGLVPALLPELGGMQTFLLSLVLSLLFFMSVLVHELAHSVYAKRQGLKIERLTLFVFGGAAELQEEPKRPGQEFIMAGLGPLTSLLVGIFFAVIWVVGMAAGSELLAVAGLSLSAINVILAAFNLLPGFPLDGGRMFRALVWKSTGSLEKATRYASTGGRILAYLLIGYGILILFSGALFSGVWMIVIGFFLLQAAQLSYQQTLAQIILDDVTVNDLMSRDFTTVPRNASIADFIRKNVLRRKQTAFPVEPNAEKPAGGMIFLDTIEGAHKNKTVGDFAVDGQLSVYPRDSAAKAWQIFLQTGVSKLPVVERSKLVGVISLENIQAYVAGRTALLSGGHRA